MNLKKGDILTCKVGNRFYTLNKKYKVSEIYFDDKFGRCISIIDNIGAHNNYSIKLVNGENYETYFSNTNLERKYKLEKLKKL